MKAFKLITVITVLLFTTVSCVENSDKYKAILAQRDSLQMQAQTIEAGYKETIGILNDVEAGFASMREIEGNMMLDIKSVEGNNNNKKQQIAIQLNQLKEILAQNKKRIEQLQRQSTQKGKESTTLALTIKRMQTELDEKTAYITSLQDELAKKNIKIEELVTTVDSLNTDITVLNQVSEKQQHTIKNQDININTVWYSVATYEVLKNARVISTNGLFRPRTVLDKDFDRSVFIQTDLRNMSSVTTGSKRIKILSSHPQDSYNLVKDENKIITIDIINPTRFWSVSRYLVVQK
ncbi:MAG: hypothetical protein VB066_09185 [Paludibacter sp.]|nr:hypothetical protein [Paludibacter sp.]